MAEYTPTDDHMRSLFCRGYAQGDFTKHDQAWSAWEKWLAAHDARVRQEAERSALDGLIAWHLGNSHDTETPIAIRRGLALMAYEAERYRDTHYTETEDQT